MRGTGDRWSFDRLAGGVLAGTTWVFLSSRAVKTAAFEVSKPPDTGGLVTPAAVSEQIVYEVGDPASYRLPDVTCDFSHVTGQTEVTPETVSVSGARGRAPGGQYKVSTRPLSTVFVA